MSQPKHTQEFLNKRRLMAFIPIPGVICLTLLFYLGGGGKGAAAEGAAAGPGSSGINRTLPSAGKTKLFADKMQAAKAPQDSTHRNGLAFSPAAGDQVPAAGATAAAPGAPGAATGSTPAGMNYTVQPGQAQRYDANNDPNVAAVQSRMQALQQQTAAQQQQQTYASAAPAGSAGGNGRGAAPAGSAGGNGRGAAPAAVQDTRLDESLKELDQLKNQYQQRLQAMSTGGAAPAAAVATTTSKPKKGMSVITQVRPTVVSSLSRSKAPTSTTRNGFHTVGESSSSAPMNAVPAVIHNDQVVSQGSTVKMRLLEDVQLEGRTIPRNSFLYGVCNVSGNRLTITATQVQYQGSLLPVSLKAFDIDGGEGLNIPGSMDRDAAKQGLASGASSADLLTMSPSLGAQAAGIAIQTGKALAGKKIKLVKIHLKANYQLLLKS